MLYTFKANSGSYDRTALLLEGTSFRSMAEALPMVKKMVTNLVESGSKVSRWVLTSFKGIVHNFFVYRSNLIFWIVMGCGIADFGRRGL